MKLLRAALLVSLFAVACRGQGGTFTPKEDAGETMLPCSTTADCGGQGICVAGLCQQVRSCQDDDDCASEGKVCHTNRFYCVECDGQHADECPANFTCQYDFTCVMVGGGGTDAGTSMCSGNCTDRTECGPDNVCKDGACCPPPTRCFSPNDCPVSQPECNGATGECFGGSGCFNDMDCDDEPGCGGGICRCDIGMAPPGNCVLRDNECDTDDDCRMNGAYVGLFCTINATPRRCLTAPDCTSDAQCVSEGLICDLAPGSDSNGKCVNGMPCTPGGMECNPTTQICDPMSMVCVGQNCINTPTLCMPDETCDPATGQCVQSGCMVDTDCNTGFWCNTAQGMCQPGCRDNSDCGAGGVCDANHQCQTMTGVCGACMDDADCPAGTRCVDATMMCHETCSMAGGMPCSDPNRQCIFGNCSCFL